jgi:hypothetical protein
MIFEYHLWWNFHLTYPMSGCVTTTMRLYRLQKTQYYLILFKPSSTQHTHWIQGVQQHWENTNPGKEKDGEATQFSPSHCVAAAWQATMVQPSLNISPFLLGSCNQQLSNQQCTKTKTIISLVQAHYDQTKVSYWRELRDHVQIFLQAWHVQHHQLTQTQKPNTRFSSWLYPCNVPVTCQPSSYTAPSPC